MTQLLGLLVILAVLGVLAAVVKHFLSRSAGPSESDHLPYRRKDYLLSKPERAFYHVLRKALGDQWTIFAKVRLLDLLWLPRGTQATQAHRNRVQSKHVDFVLCEPATLTPILVIELDDRSHEREDRQNRDRFVDRALESAGLPVLHVPARDGYVVNDLADQIRTAVSQPRAVVHK
jgi:very-short-patch-repair endonuclease